MADLSVLNDPSVDEFEVLFRPRSLVLPLFNEFVVRGIVNTWAAASLVWAIRSIDFPVIDRVTHLRVRVFREDSFIQAAASPWFIAGVAAAALGTALFVFFSLVEVRRIFEVGGTVGFSLAALAAIGVVAVFILREVNA